MKLPLVVAITGASGAVYGVRLLEVLLHSGYDIHLTISPSGKEVIAQELKRQINLEDFRLDSLLDIAAFSGSLALPPPHEFSVPHRQRLVLDGRNGHLPVLGQYAQCGRVCQRQQSDPPSGRCPSQGTATTDSRPPGDSPIGAAIGEHATGLRSGRSRLTRRPRLVPRREVPPGSRRLHRRPDTRSVEHPAHLDETLGGGK